MNCTKVLKWSALIVAVAFHLLTSAAQAAPITVQFSGYVTLTQAPFLPIALNDGIAGSYTFESSAADSNASPGIGSYPGAITAYSVTVGAHSLSATAGQIAVFNNISPGVDVYDAVGNSFSNVVPIAGYLPGLLLLELVDPTQTVFASDALPFAPDLADFSTRSFLMRYGQFTQQGTFTADVRGVITSLTVSSPVPAPGALALLALGLMGIGGLRTRRSAA